jgi:chemotaxis protein methyltransferase CheR
MTPTRSLAERAEREFEFSMTDFERVRRMIHARAGINLNPSKQNMVYSRLARRLRVLGCASFSEYLDSLESGRRNVEEWEHFVNALTTNLTAFFREAHHFPILAELLRARRTQSELSIWCCAASTGEEPYSIAMTAMDALPGAAARVRVLATDIDTNVLDVARTGVYSLDRIEKLDDSLCRRHFFRGRGPHEGKVRVRPELQALLTYRRLNLLDPQWDVRGGFDAIFCRNVMIYFDKPTQRRILEKFAPLLKPGGLLFVGHSENLYHARDLFVPRGKTVYERAADVAAR